MICQSIRIVMSVILVAAIIESVVGQHAEKREEVLAALRQPVRQEYFEDTLRDVAATLAEQLDIPIFLDRQGLSTADPPRAYDTAITFSCTDISAHDALLLMLDQHGLGYTVGPGYLVLTSRQAAEFESFVRIYDVTDLVSGVSGQGKDVIEIIDQDFQRTSNRESALIDLIVGSIAPDMWELVGGPGTVESFASNGRVTLSVAQTAQVHLELEEFLDELHHRHPPADGAHADEAEPQASGDEPETFVRIYWLNADSADSAADLSELVQTSFPRSWWENDYEFAKAIGGFVVVRQSGSRHRFIHQLLTNLGALRSRAMGIPGSITPVDTSGD